jgi:hypothetical protein
MEKGIIPPDFNKVFLKHQPPPKLEKKIDGDVNMSTEETQETREPEEVDNDLYALFKTKGSGYDPLKLRVERQNFLADEF